MRVSCLIWFFCCLLAAGCHRGSGHAIVDVSHIGDQQAAQIILNAIHKAGGWDAYKNIKTISYKKRSVLYHDDGSLESDRDQYHSYTLQPSVTGEITWSFGNDSYAIHYTDEEAYKLENGARVEGSEESARNTFLSAYYVLFMPFKLLDPGAVLTYEGTTTLETGDKVHIIKADYDPGKHDNHSTHDIWWYFFDSKTYEYLACQVYHEPTYAFIENNEITEEHLITFNTYRKSFRTDADRNKEFLRGEFWYSDFQIILTGADE